MRPGKLTGKGKEQFVALNASCDIYGIVLFAIHRTNALRNALGQLDGNRHVRGDRFQRGFDRWSGALPNRLSVGLGNVEYPLHIEVDAHRSVGAFILAVCLQDKCGFLAAFHAAPALLPVVIICDECRVGLLRHHKQRIGNAGLAKSRLHIEIVRKRGRVCKRLF